MGDSPVTLITGGGSGSGSGIGAAPARQLLDLDTESPSPGGAPTACARSPRSCTNRKACSRWPVTRPTTATSRRPSSPPSGRAVTGLAENTRRLVTGDGVGVGVTLINPGATATNLFDADGGLADRAMLTADQLASSIVWAITQPSGVDVNTVTVRPVGNPL